ncbi:MAG: tetratricopeptide repeat protein, partial [Phycisphaerales bacterium]|nr:tetratricopeptide repeat protein [Phycisphaerales bacterium]
RHDQAEVMFYQALQYEGDHALAYSSIAESLLDRRDFDRAIYCFREAAAIDPALPRVHARLAFAYAETGRQERARQLYLRELRDHPGDIDTLLDLGCLLLDMNRLGEASEKFRRVLELESDNPDAHFHLGELALRRRNLRDAHAAFRLVIRLDPTYPEARRRLASLLLDENEVGEARKHLRRELREFRRNPSEF